MKYLLFLSLPLFALTSTGQVAHCSYTTDSVRTVDFDTKTRLPVDNTFTIAFADSGRITIINKETKKAWKIQCIDRTEDFNPTSKSGDKYEYVEYDALRDSKETIRFAIVYNITRKYVFSAAVEKDNVLVVFFLNKLYKKTK